MTVYIEYAFLQNFLIDGALLWLAGRASRLSLRWWRIVLSAVIGAAFAVVFPFLSLSGGMALCLKLAVGLLLPLLAMSKKKGGRYAMNAVFFLLFSFAFGGVLLAGMHNYALERLSFGWVAVGIALLAMISVFFVEKWYKKRSVYRHVYDCRVKIGGKSAKIKGFYDSGNLATRKGRPVCFLAADILYDLCGEGLFSSQREGQVCDEMCIATQSGEKRIPLYKGEIYLQTRRDEVKKEVYFARAANRISREYKIILHSRVFEGCEEETYELHGVD